MVTVPGLMDGAPGTTARPDLTKQYNTFNLKLGQIRFIGKEKWQPELENFDFDYVRPIKIENVNEQGKRADLVSEYKKTDDILDDDTFQKKYTTPILVTVRKYGAKLNRRGFVYEHKHPTLYRMAMEVGLEDPQILALCYRPGESALIHTDQHPGYDVYDPRKKENNMLPKNGGMQRVMIQLQDRQPGSFMQMDNEVYTDWQAGDVSIFDERYFHSYGNASNQDRWILRVTGKVTDKFKEFLNKKEIQI